MVEKKKIKDWNLGDEHRKTFRGTLEGKVWGVENKKQFSRIWIMSENGCEEAIDIPVEVHSKILLYQNVAYIEEEVFVSDLECTGFKDDGPSGPTGVYRRYNERTVKQQIKVLDGEFKGIEYKAETKKRIYQKK